MPLKIASFLIVSPRSDPVLRTRNSHEFTEPADPNFGFKCGTMEINLLVFLSIPKFVQARRKW